MTPPRLTIRARLTLVYGGLFVLAGVLLLGVTYALVWQRLPGGAELNVSAAPTSAGGQPAQPPHPATAARRPHYSWNGGSPRTPGGTRRPRCSPGAGSRWPWSAPPRSPWVGCSPGGCCSRCSG
jgi:hypothetical protein